MDPRVIDAPQELSLQIRKSYVQFARIIECHASHSLRKALGRQAAVALIGPREIALILEKR